MVADGEKTELHHQSANFSEKQRQNRDIQNKTMHIAAANMTNINGFSGIYTAGWCQNAGEKTVYALHQEKGQPVLLEIGTAGGCMILCGAVRNLLGNMLIPNLPIYVN